jgi:hypothetical protein
MPKKAAHRGTVRTLLKTVEGYGYVPPPNLTVSWRYVHCAGFDAWCKNCPGRRFRFQHYLHSVGFKCPQCGGTEFERHFHHFDNIPCSCAPGPQETTIRLGNHVDELAGGGGRGSSKSECGFPLSVRGNPEVANPTPTDISYINHRSYRFLVFRKNSKDLEDCFRRAKEFYGPLGGVPTESPTMKITFPSGAEGIFDHLADADAWEKYQGQEFQFIWAEEITQIPEERRWTRLCNSCRSPFPEIKALKYATANPSGPGLGWFVKRFIDLTDEAGQKIKPGTIYTDPATGLRRAFVHSTVYDNPFFLRDQMLYVKQLESEGDEYERRKWLLGDFTCNEGSYFPMFRPDGPFPHEKAKYPWARHVVPSDGVRLEPWWPRWMACDWGFAHKSAVYWACQSPQGQMFVYRELVRNETLLEVLGAEIARATMPDLRAMKDAGLQPMVTMYLSHELFDKTGEEKTRAEQLRNGMERILGLNSAVVLTTQEEAALDSKGSPEDFFSARGFQKTAAIVLRRAHTARISGWQYLRSLMRFVPLAQPSKNFFDMQHAIRLATEDGATAYFNYLKEFEEKAPEALPGLQILDCCPYVIKAIPMARHNEPNEGDPEDVPKKHFDGLDELDAIRYLAAAQQKEGNREPRGVFVAARIAAQEHAGLDWNQRVQIAERATRDYDADERGKPFTIPRAGSRRAHWSEVN